MKIKQEDEGQLVKRLPNRKKKLVRVEAQYIDSGRSGILKLFAKRGWFNFGKYKDRKTAEMVIELNERKRDYMKYRIKE